MTQVLSVFDDALFSLGTIRMVTSLVPTTQVLL